MVLFVLVVPSKTQVWPKDIESGMTIDNKEFLDKEDSDFHPQQSFSAGPFTHGRMVDFDYIGFRMYLIIMSFM